MVEAKNTTIQWSFLQCDVEIFSPSGFKLSIISIYIYGNKLSWPIFVENGNVVPNNTLKYQTVPKKGHTSRVQ